MVIRGNRRTRAEAAAWTLADFRARCGSGAVFRFVSDAASRDWGGFDHDRLRTVALGDLLGEVEAGAAIYGFDFDLKCDCEAFVRNATVLPYFKRDAFPRNELETAVWPCLIAGPPGSRSQLHVDNSFLPLWLTLLSGRKVFRAVDFGTWRRELVPRGVVDADGATLVPLDSYGDDAALLAALGGARVYSSTLEPGDSVYVPVGALHGGRNVGAEPALAVTANFDDAAHHPLLIAHYCEGYLLRNRRSGEARLDALVASKSCLAWAGVLGARPAPRTPGDRDSPARMADVVYPDGAFCRNHHPDGRRRPCARAAAACARDGPRDDAPSRFVDDANGDGAVSRQEVALRFADMSPNYLDRAATLADVKAWVAREVDAIWPPGDPRVSAADIDAAIARRFFDADGTEL